MWHKNRMRIRAALVAVAVVLCCAVGGYAAQTLPDIDIEAEAAILVDAATGQVYGQDHDHAPGYGRD